MARDKIKVTKNLQYYKFCGYGFFKNLRLFEPFLILFFLSNGLTFLQIGTLYSVREITRNVLEVPAGIAADALGRRRTMVASFGFYILSFIVYYLGTEFWAFLPAMVLYALGDAFRTGTHKAMIFDYLKIMGWADQKAYYYGHTRSYSQLGSAFSSLIGGFMVFYTGNYRDIFIYTSVPYLIDLFLVSSYPRSLDGLRSGFSRQQAFSNFREVFRGFVETFRKVGTLRIVANLSLHTGFYQAVKDYLQPVLQTLAVSLPLLLAYNDQQRTAVIVGIVYFLIFLLTSFSSRKAGVFSSYFTTLSRPLNLTLAAGLASGLLCGLFYGLEFVFAAVVVYVLIFLNENLRKPIGVSQLADHSGKAYLATVLSAESQFHSLITALLAPVIGLLADVWGLGWALLSVSGGLLLLLPLVMLKGERGQPRAGHS